MTDWLQAARNAAYEALADTGVMSDEIDCALNAAAPHLAAAERERIYAELGSDHYVIFTADRWTVEHSVECRLSGHMHECDAHTAAVRVTSLPDFRPVPGRWRITGIRGGLPDLERAEPTAPEGDTRA